MSKTFRILMDDHKKKILLCTDIESVNIFGITHYAYIISKHQRATGVRYAKLNNVR